MNLLIGLFHWHRLVLNVANFKAMTCQPVKKYIRGGGGTKVHGKGGDLP